MSDPVRLVTAVEQPTIAVRVVVPMADLDVGAIFGSAMGRLFPYVGQHGLQPAGPPYARYAEFGPERADVEVGVPLASPAAELPDLAPDDALGATTLPGGEAAEYRHVGSYQRLGEAYQAIEAWMKESGRSAAGAPWESYLVSPPDVGGDPDRLETLVLWPLSPR